MDAEEAVRSELSRMAAEAETDGQARLAERLRIAREHDRLRRTETRKRSLAERRRAIRESYARRDRIRRARVARAFMAAALLDRRELRRLAVGLAATGVVLAGGGLGLALVAAGVAVAALPTRERARAIALEAQMQRQADRTDTDRALAQAYDEVAAEYRHQTAGPAPLRFGTVDKRLRGLVGLYAHFVLGETEGRLQAGADVTMAAVARALGPLAPAVEATLLGTGRRSGLVVLGWYDPADARHRRAAAAALYRAGETAAARGLAPPRPQNRSAGTARDRGRGR